MVALKEAGYTSVELLDTAADDFMVTMATGGFDVAFIAMHGAGGGMAPCKAPWDPGYPLHGFGCACQRLRCRQGGL